MSTPVNDEVIRVSAKEIIENGMTSSHMAKAINAPLCASAGRNTPRCHAMGNNTSAPSAIRPQATTEGDRSTSATLIKK
jgi:hypothetical protein